MGQKFISRQKARQYARRLCICGTQMATRVHPKKVYLCRLVFYIYCNMANFGFSIKKTRSFNLSQADLRKADQLLEEVPSYRLCIGCGGCTATCSARQFTDFDIRKVHNTFRRGQYDKLADELRKCMLCGKCTLVCPRGVNLRSLIINMRQLLTPSHETF